MKITVFLCGYPNISNNWTVEIYFVNSLFQLHHLVSNLHCLQVVKQRYVFITLTLPSLENTLCTVMSSLRLRQHNRNFITLFYISLQLQSVSAVFLIVTVYSLYILVESVESKICIHLRKEAVPVFIQSRVKIYLLTLLDEC